MPCCIFKVSLPKLLDHILEDCPLWAEYRRPLDQNNFCSVAYGGIKVPWIPEEILLKLTNFNAKSCRVKILRLSVCNPKISRSTIHFYTFFLGCMRELKFEKDGPSIERTGRVISASTDIPLICFHPGVLRFQFSDIRVTLNVTSINLNFMFKVQVFESEDE